MSRLVLIFILILTASLTTRTLATPCDPDKRWDEGTNELSEDTEKCTDLVGKVQGQNEPENQFELQDRMFNEKGPVSDLPMIERETSFIEGDQPGTVGEMITTIRNSPEVKEAMGNVEQVAEESAAKIAGFDSSGIDAATKISFDDASSLTNGAFSNSEFSDLNLSETAIEALGLDGMVIMIGQMLMPSYETSSFPEHMSGVEKARLALSFIPIVSQIYNLGADIAEAVQGGVAPAGVAEIVTIDLMRDVMGFFLPETAMEQWAFGGIIGEINQQGAANKAASQVVDALSKDDYNHKVVDAVHKKVGKLYFDTVCPIGTVEGAYGCLVDRIDDHAGRDKWSYFVSSDVLYVHPKGGQCPPKFHFDGSNCRSDPEIITVGRKVWQFKEGSIWISRWPHQCEDDTTFDGHNCKVNGIDGGMKGRHPVVKENRLYISAIGNHCPDGYKYNNLYHLCQRNKIIRMDGRKAWAWKDSLYTSPVKPPNPRDIALYLSHAELYQKWGNPDHIYDSLLSSKDYGKKFQDSLSDIMTQLRMSYPLTIAAFQNSVKSSYPNQSLSHLLGFQSLASVRLNLLQRQLLELRYALRAQLNAHLNLSYSGLTGCDRLLPSPYSFRTEADFFSWLNFCQRQNSQHEVLSVEGGSFAFHNKKMAQSDEKAITKAYQGYLDHRKKLLDQVVSDMSHLQDEGKANFVADMKDKEDKVQVMTTARAAADKVVADVGKSVLNQLINGDSLCVVNFLPGKNNCTANVSMEGTIFGEDTTYQGHKDFHIKCFGSKNNGPLLDSVKKKASSGSVSVWFTGNCNSDVVAFGFDHSHDTLFNPNQLKHKQAAGLAKVRDHFQGDISKTAYYLDRNEYVKYLSHEKGATNPFPNKNDSFTNSKDIQALLALDKKRADRLTAMEAALYKEKPGFIYNVNDFLVKHLRGKKSYKDVLDPNWGRISVDKDWHITNYPKVDFDLFEYFFVNYAQELCRIQQVDKKQPGDCFDLVTPYARMILDYCYGLSQLKVVPKSDKDKGLIYTSYKERPKKPQEKVPDNGWAGAIEALGKWHKKAYRSKVPLFPS